MMRRKLTIPERWQAVGMHNGGFSHRMVADHFRVNHSIIVQLMQHFRQTGNVTDRPCAGRPRKTTLRRGPAHIQMGVATALQYSWCTSW
jgi:transposase